MLVGVSGKRGRSGYDRVALCTCMKLPKIKDILKLTIMSKVIVL